jgi:hypothetical protein
LPLRQGNAGSYGTGFKETLDWSMAVVEKSLQTLEREEFREGREL